MESKALAVSRRKRSLSSDYMVSPAFPRQETFLGGVGQLDDSRHDGPRYSSSKDAIVRIGDTKGTSVGDEPSVLFGEGKGDLY